MMTFYWHILHVAVEVHCKYLLGYKQRWLNEYPWLESVQSGKATGMLCALCKNNPTLLSILGEDPEFISGGHQN